MRNQNQSLRRKTHFAVLSWTFVVSICVHILFAPLARAGSITREVFQGITGTTIADLTNNPAYPNNPTTTNVITDFFESPTDIMEDYGQRMHGYVVPPVTGNYTFWIATDDNGSLYLSTDENPANIRAIASVPGWVSSRNWGGYAQQQSAPIALQAGKAYYVSALMKEGGGGDNLAVRWLRPDGVDQAPIPATYLLPWGTSFTPPQITQQPTNTTVVEGSMANFTVKVSNLDAISYKWFKGATPVTGGTNETLTYGPVTFADEGASFSATLTNKLGSTNSASAILHVTADVTPPTLTRVLNLSPTSLQVTFSEPVDSSTATFQLDGGVTVTLASPGSDLRNVVLVTSQMTMGATYTLTVSGVKDRAQTPNTIAPNSQISFIALEFVSQNIGGVGGSISRVADGQFDVIGPGKDIGGTSDHFQYAWQQRTGDFDLQVRLRDVKITDTFVHAGLMARATLDTNSPFAAAFASSARVGSFFESRATVGAASSTPTPVGSFPANYPEAWLRLKRVGNVFTGYGSLDGLSWVQLGTTTFTAGVMPTTLYFGLAISSQSATQTSFAQFRDFGTTVNLATGAAYKPEHEPLMPSSRATGLVFSEVMYHPKADPRFQNDLEYIEIYNADDLFEDLSGYQLAGGVTYKFPNGYILPAGAFVVIALDPTAVRTAYGVTNVLGPYTGKLDNAGDKIELRDGFGALKLEMEYRDAAPWPMAADGAGHSIVLTRPSYGENDARAWGASSQIGGSPGRDDLIVANPQKEVWINEFLANSDGSQEPFVEIYNHNLTSVDLSGCYITDSQTTNKFRIPDATTLNGRGYRAFTATELGFTLNGAGGGLYLVSSNAMRVIDAITFGGQEAGVATGRSPDGSATIRRLSAPTPGAANAQWKVEDVVINEIMFAPISGNDDEQYIELYNRSATTINLANWKLSDGVDYTFPAGASVGPNAYVVIARNRNVILSNYANLNLGNTFGNYSGSLNDSDHIELSKIGTWVSTNQFQQVVTNGIRIKTSEVAYFDGGRWTKYADEGGSSLELVDPHGDTLRPSNWADSDETQKAPWTTNTFTGVLDLGNSGYPPDRLYVFMQDGGECLVDEIEIIPSGGVNSVANGTFDAGSTGWTFLGDHSRSGRDATGGINNSGVLHLRADDKGMQGINSVQTALTGLASGATATIRAKARWLAGFSEVLLRTRGGWLELPIHMSIPKNLGTPGLPNSRLAPTQNAGPAIYDVSHAPLLPRAGNTVTVTCKVSDADGIGPVTLSYRVDPNATYSNVTMRDDGTGGDAIAGDGIYSGNIGAQVAGALVGFKITATDLNASAATTTFPAGNMWQVALPSPECYVRWGDTLPTGTFTYYHLWSSQASEAQRSNALNNTYRDATLVYNNWRVIYNCGFRDKGSPYHGGAGSWAIMNGDDEPLLGETDRIFRATGNGGSDGVPVRNRLTQWMARKMSIPYLNSHYMQLFRNGSQFANVMQDEEYPGNQYSKQWFPDGSNGDVYKIAVWFEFANDNSSFGATGATLESFKSGGNYKLGRYRWNWNTRGFMGSANNYTNIFNLVTAANDTSTNMVQNVLNIADVEEWFRVFAYDRVLGNWDSWTYNVGQNMFAVKQAGLPWQIMPWDIDFTLGAGDGPTTGLMNGGQDPVMNNWFNVPAFRRMFWRGYQKALVSALDPAQYQPVGDALHAAMTRNNISGAGGPSGLYSYMAQRRAYIVGQIQANDVTSFTITSNGGANYTSTTPTTVLAGKAPFAVVSVAVNGTSYPAVWTDQNSWSINVPLATGANALTVTGVDAKGVLVPGNTDSITVTYTGVAQLPQDYVVINEVHYNPAEPDASFIEFYNTSTTTPFDLSGYRLDGVRYTFPDGSIIQPGKFLLVVGHRDGFALAYGQTIPVLGEFPGNLDHSGEHISLVKPLGLGGTNDLIISDVRYSSSLPWPTNANGFGPSLQLIDATKGSWRVANWGTTLDTDVDRVTPGRTNKIRGTIAAFPTLWINEVLPNNINGPTDNAGEREPYIEIYNSGTTSVSLSGFYLSDDYNNLTKWAFPAGTSIGSKQFLRIWADSETLESITGQLHTSFRLNPTNGSVALSRIQSTAAVAIDYIDYVQITPDRSIGSYPDGEPRNRRLFSNVTPGAANDPTLPPARIVINEFQASNTETLIDPATGQYEDWFELYNAGSNDVDLTSFTLTSSLTNIAEFRIPPGYVLQAGKFLLVWADETSSSNRIGDPTLHVNFKLTKAGGDIGLFDPDGKLIDGFTYGEQTNDISQGHFPDGDTGLQVTFDIPTPGAANVLSGANQPPVLGAIPDKTVAEQTQLSFTATATDPDAGQTVQYSLGVGSPAGAAIDPNTGAFTWTPTEQQGPNSYSVAIIATDNGTPARTAVRNFTITVTEANRQPTLAAIANTTIDDSTLYAFTATATDPDVPANQLTFTLLAGAPAGAAIDPNTGRFTWTPTPSQAGTHTITVRVADNGAGALSDQKSFQLTVRVVEHAPVIDPISQQFVNEGATFNLTVRATDPNSPPSSITYSLEGVDLPAGLTIDPVTGVMTWVPTESQGPQTYGVNVRATKNSGARLSSAITFGITVNEANQPPVLGSIQNVTVDEGALVSFQITAVDSDLPAQALRYSLASAPTGATIDAVSGQFTWQVPTDGAALINDISVVVTDDGPGALSDTNTFRVTLNPKFRAAINEIMYRPSAANAAYIELINPSTVRTQDLTGIILGGPRMNFAFAAGTKLLPGQIISVVQNQTAFRAAYGASLAVAGQWTGSFDRSDAWVRLYSIGAQNNTNVLDQVSFETIAPWSTQADAGAVALQLIDPTKDNSRVGNWTVAPATAAPQWQRVVQSGTASSSTMYMYLETVGDVYLDDVMLVAGSTPEVGQNFLANGDFETALTPVWTVSPNLSQSALSSTIKHSGNSSLHMITTAGGTTRASSIYQDLTTPLTQGAAYTLSYWYLPNTNGGTLTLRLSGNGIRSTVDITSTNVVQPRFTPDADNNVRVTLNEFPPVWINEVLPNNANGLTDSKGEREPWIELINTGSTPLDLTGWYLTADYANLAGWQFPAGTTIPAGGFLVVFADGETADATPSELHTSFRLPATNGKIGLVRSQATGLAVVDYANYGTIAADSSLASIPDAQAFQREITIAPTPANFNTASPNRPPTIATVGTQNVNVGEILNVTISGSDPDQPQQSITYTLDSAPAGVSIGASSGLLNWQPTGAQVGTHPVTVRVTDNGLPALSATATFNIIVTQPNRPPTITTVATQNIKVGDVLNLTVVASDPDSQQSLTYSLDAAPQGATIGGSSGLFNWQPNSTQVGAQTVTVRVRDNGSPQLSATSSFTINVAMTNRPPTVTAVPNQSIKVGDLLNLTVSGSDPDQPQQSIAFSLDAAPQGATIGAASGAFSWQPNSSQVGVHPVTVRVTDNGQPQLSVTTSFNITVAMTNRPPTITPVTTQNIKVGEALNLTVSANDPDQPQQTLTFSLDTPPQGATINASSGAFAWTPTGAQTGTNRITVRVADNGSPLLSVTASFDVVVTMTNRPPTITPVATQNIKVGEVLNLTVSASDPDQPQQTLTFSLDTPPQGVTINASSGAFAWTPTGAQTGTNKITVRVADNGSPLLSVTASFDVVVTMTNRPPTITPVATQNIKVGEALNLTVAANDPDQPQQTLTFSLDTPPQGATINTTSGAFAWTPTSAQVGTNKITVRVTDNGSPSLSATNTFDVVVTAQAAITITGTINAGSSPNLTWNTQAGVVYRVEYKQNLTDATWTLLRQVTATGASESVIDSTPGQTRFYRVVAP